MKRNEQISLSVGTIILIIILGSLIPNKIIDVAQAIQITITFLLIMITLIYVFRTSEIATTSRQQAAASVRMAEEARIQRVIASRPVIIQEAMPRKYAAERHLSDYFQVSNAGSSPAIELEITILNKEKVPIKSERKTFLRPNDPPLQLLPFDSLKLDESMYYLVSEYQSISSRGQTWYQTWLPFELSKSANEDKMYVKAGELEFKEVGKKERIDAFSSRSKPQ